MFIGAIKLLSEDEISIKEQCLNTDLRERLIDVIKIICVSYLHSTVVWEDYDVSPVVRHVRIREFRENLIEMKEDLRDILLYVTRKKVSKIKHINERY